jgi:DNA-binding CsgD family transcriptional regulator
MPQASVRREVGRLAHCGLDVRRFSLRAARALRREVPFDGLCLLTLDPATMLPTGEIVENGLPPEATRRLSEIEFGEPDINKFTDLVRSRRLAATLSEATGGKLERSLRHRELRGPHGFGDELRAVLVNESGTWGALTLMRNKERADFESRETRLVESLSRPFAEGLQRANVFASATSDAHDQADPGTGVLLLADDNSVELADSAAEAWLEELREDGGAERPVPPVIDAVANRARASARGTELGDAGLAARARVRTPSGRWVIAHGSVLGEGADARTAVTLEHAGSPDLAPLIADAYELTERERVVTELVALGLSTNAIGSRLYLSAYTVQDHLKSIFEKVGVSSRGELVARLFFEHDLPRLLPTPEGEESATGSR